MSEVISNFNFKELEMGLFNYSDLMDMSRDKLEALRRIHQENIDQHHEYSYVSRISKKYKFNLRSLLRKIMKVGLIFFIV